MKLRALPRISRVSLALYERGRCRSTGCCRAPDRWRRSTKHSIFSTGPRDTPRDHVLIRPPPVSRPPAIPAGNPASRGSRRGRRDAFRPSAKSAMTNAATRRLSVGFHLQTGKRGLGVAVAPAQRSGPRPLPPQLPADTARRSNDRRRGQRPDGRAPACFQPVDRVRLLDRLLWEAASSTPAACGRSGLADRPQT